MAEVIISVWHDSIGDSKASVFGISRDPAHGAAMMRFVRRLLGICRIGFVERAAGRVRTYRVLVNKAQGCNLRVWCVLCICVMCVSIFYTKYSITSIRILCEYLENHPQADIRYYLKNSFTSDFCLLGTLYKLKATILIPRRESFVIVNKNF